MPLTKAPSGPRISASGLITVLVAWVTVTIFGAKVFYPSPQPLQELLTSTLAWQVLLAGVLLATVITWGPDGGRWDSDARAGAIFHCFGSPSSCLP